MPRGGGRVLLSGFGFFGLFGSLTGIRTLTFGFLGFFWGSLTEFIISAFIFWGFFGEASAFKLIDHAVRLLIFWVFWGSITENTNFSSACWLLCLGFWGKYHGKHKV